MFSCLIHVNNKDPVYNLMRRGGTDMKKFMILTGVTGMLLLAVLIFDSVNAKDVYAPVIQDDSRIEEQE